MRQNFVLLSGICLFPLGILSGCGGLTSPPQTHVSLSGHVHGGQQPVEGATIQLYAVGTTGDGSAATPLISIVLTTSDGTSNPNNANANPGNAFNSLPPGFFTITSDYTCPSPIADVYIVATGGNPGAGNINPNLALLTALGACGSLSAASYITVNELTTVASAASIASFSTGYASIGSTTSDIAPLQSAFATVSQLINTSTGAVPGPNLPNGFQAPVQLLNTAGDIIASCVNSEGGEAGDGSPCGNLFLQTTPPGGTAPSDTFAAALNLILFPTNNLSQTFNLLSASSPFQPTLSTVPTSWSIAVTPVGQTIPISYPAIYGLDLYLPFSGATADRLKDVTGNGHDGLLSGSGSPATFPGLVGITPNDQTVIFPNASGRPSLGTCAYFPAGRANNNYGYLYGLAAYYTGGGQNGTNMGGSYGPGNGIYHLADAYFPQIGRSNGGSSTIAATGYSGIHCVEAIPADINGPDHIIVDGQEVPYLSQGYTNDVVGGLQLTAPLYLLGGSGIQFGTPITTFSVWATTSADSPAVAQIRTSSELSRLQYLGVPIGYTPSNATDSTCSIDGTSIDQGFGAANIPTSSLLNLLFPCTLHDFSLDGQPPMDMAAGFQDRAASVYHPKAARNIAYNGGVINGVIAMLEPPAAALQDILNWNNQAHALGYKTIVTTMMSECGYGYNGESGDQLATQFNALLLANADLFDWVDNLAAWPLLGATGACNGPAFVDGVHISSTIGQPLYVANERAAFEGAYASAVTSINAAYNQLPSDRNIQAAGSTPYGIQLIDANSASFNSAGKLCISNTGTQSVTLIPADGELIDGAQILPISAGSTVCVRPTVINATTAGANWTQH